jgi:hypothetical protein
VFHLGCAIVAATKIASARPALAGRQGHGAQNVRHCQGERLSMVVQEYVTYNTYTVDVTYHLVVADEHVRLLFHQRFLAALRKTARHPLVLMDIFLLHTCIRQLEAGLCSKTDRQAYSKIILRSAIETTWTSCNHVMQSCCLAYSLLGQLRQHSTD